MSLEVRCTCGWCCQASEYYLGDRIACPECGTRVLVHGRSGVPYGYAPYPTWQKRFPVRTPNARRALMIPIEDPHAGAALWLGVFSIFAALTGCGAVLAVVLAVFAIKSAVRSNAWNRKFARPVQGRAQAALVLSSMAVLLAGITFFSFVVDSSHQRPPRPSEVRRVTVEQSSPYRHENQNAAQRELRERLNRHRSQQQEWERAVQDQGRRSPEEPKRTPVAPKNDFERLTSEYSESIRKDRAK